MLHKVIEHKIKGSSFESSAAAAAVIGRESLFVEISIDCWLGPYICLWCAQLMYAGIGYWFEC